MTDEEKRRLSTAFAIAKADNADINEGEMGMYFWGKYGSHYLDLADKALAASSAMLDDELLQALSDELQR